MPDHPLDELLEEARMAASSDWEEAFVADLKANRDRYGLDWNPTGRQVEKLQEIAHGDDK